MRFSLTILVSMLLAVPVLAATNATTATTNATDIASDKEVTAVVEHIMKTLESGVLLVTAQPGQSRAGSWMLPHPSDKYASVVISGMQCSAITPYGWRAVPELLKWLDHKEAFMRYIASESLVSITGLHPTFYVFGTPHETFNGDRDWFEKAKSTWSSWYEDLRRKKSG